MTLTQAILLFATVVVSMLVGFVIYLAKSAGKTKEENRELLAKIKTSNQLKKENDEIANKLLDGNRTGISSWKSDKLRNKNRNN